MASYIASQEPGRAPPATPARPSRVARSRVNPPPIQAKLEVGSPGDRYEREADAVADRVMQMPTGDPSELDTPPRPLSVMRFPDVSESATRLQRACAACDAEREEVLQRQAQPGSPPVVGAGFEAKLSALRLQGGEPLPAGTRRFMESRFGHDFGHVRVHADEPAAALAADVRAKAFTLGGDIVFGKGQYRPRAISGQRLLAHELTHTLQQNPKARIRRDLLGSDTKATQKKIDAFALAQLRLIKSLPSTRGPNAPLQPHPIPPRDVATSRSGCGARPGKALHLCVQRGGPTTVPR